MGTSTSSLHSSSKETDIINLMMPLYFTNEKISQDEHESAKSSWNLILNDTSPKYLLLKKDAEFEYSSCITYFYDSFYARLFELHPLAKGLFKSGIKSQGNFLVKMISLALTELNESLKLKNTLVKLAEVHNERGVKAIECKNYFLQ
jgi:hypothetical protein